MADFELAQDAIALVAATAKSVLELGSAAGSRIAILEWWYEFDGVSASAVPVKVELGRFSAGVTTATTVTADKMDPGSAAALTTSKHSTSTEGAGTPVGTPLAKRCPPTSGFHYVAPPDRLYVVAVSSFWRMRLTAAANVNVTCGVIWREIG